jgi:cell division protein YceG involved in septum cleavage
VLIFCIYLFTKNITLDAKISIEQGESTAKIFNQLSMIEKLRMKLYIKTHTIDFSKLEAGSYTFSGSYSKAEFVANILKGSEKDYLRLTILEGRSIYDIDEALARKGYITGGDFVSYVTNYGTISELMQGYEFLRQIPTNI